MLACVSAYTVSKGDSRCARLSENGKPACMNSLYSGHASILACLSAYAVSMNDSRCARLTANIRLASPQSLPNKTFEFCKKQRLAGRPTRLLFTTKPTTKQPQSTNHRCRKTGGRDAHRPCFSTLREARPSVRTCKPAGGAPSHPPAHIRFSDCKQ